MELLFKIFIISIALTFSACGSMSPTENRKPIDSKLLDKELRKAERALENEDIQTALGITRKYAEMGNAKAQYMHARYTYLKFYVENYGKGSSRSIRRSENKANEEVLKWTSLSANQGFAFAQMSLGMIYSEEGKGVTVNLVTGLMWTILGASQSPDESYLQGQIDQFLNNHKLSDKEINKAKRLAKEWKPIN